MPPLVEVTAWIAIYLIGGLWSIVTLAGAVALAALFLVAIMAIAAGGLAARALGAGRDPIP